MNTTPLSRSQNGDPPRDVTIGHLFSRLANETGRLIQQELALATTEMTSKATFAAKQLVFIGAAGFLTFISLMALSACLVLGLAPEVPMWLSSLIIGVVFLGVAAGMVFKAAHSLKHLDLAPKQTIETLQETKLWLHQQVR